MFQYVSVSSLTEIQQLYDKNRFLDAFGQSGEYWRPSTRSSELSTDELILGGRLAMRLGGWRLSRKLLRVADSRDPGNPRVRFFANHVRRRSCLLEDLHEFEANPHICAEDPEMQAAWLASHAATWAFLRDFPRAHDCLDRAYRLRPRDGWVLSYHSDVFGMEDRWLDALQCAEQAWEVDPGAPHAARCLSSALLNLGRVEESAQRLAAASENCQSYEIVQLACWYKCAVAETIEPQSRRHVLDEALALAERLPELAPLADRGPLRFFSRIRLDIAELADDHAELEKWAQEAHIPFYRKIVANLRSDPGGERIRLSFPRAIQKHETCLPTSLSSALATVGVQLDPDVMAAEITFGGTAAWAAAEWLEKRGLSVRFFGVTPQTAVSLIKNGIAFVLTLEGDDYAHAVAAIGLDVSAGTLLIHDPSAYRTAEYLLEDLENRREPLGIKGMAVVPAEKASLLDQLLAAESVALVTAARMYEKALTLQGPSAAREIVDAIATKFPEHPGTRLLAAVQAAEEGRTGEALLAFQQLLNGFPHSAFVRFRLLDACRARANSALMRETLAGVVQRGVLPGVQSQQDWRLPPGRYVAEYADLLRFSDGTRDQARSLLHDVIRRQPRSADGWHVLADLCWHDRDRTRALLCYRIAACLATGNEHYSVAYADALARNHQEEEGFSWLETRVRRFGASPHAVGTWISYIRTLEKWGRPERALSACADALAKHDSSPELLVFAVPFFARMGDWQKAEDCLARLEQTGNLPRFREAATEFYRLSGDLRRAIEQAEAWMRELPRQMSPRYAIIDLIAKRNGIREALEMASQWVKQNPWHEALEELRYARLDRAGEPKWKGLSVLLRRLKRNPEDAWAWRELAFRCIERYDTAGDKKRSTLGPRIAQMFAQCDRTGADDPATFRVRARWHQVRGEWDKAVVAWLRSLDRDPSNAYSCQRLWECATGFSADERRKVWEQMQPILLRCPGHLAIAHDIVPLLAQRFGAAFAENTVLGWRESRAEDPEITKALADLLLEQGHGRTDAERAYVLVRESVSHFPYNLGLRFSFVQACRHLGKLEEAEEGLREITRRHPDNSGARIQLAWVNELRGQHEEALTLLDSAASRDPQNRQITDSLVQILIRQGHLARAKKIIVESLEQSPRDIYWRGRAIRLLLDCGDEEAAVATARYGVRVFPDGAYLWFLLAALLNQLRHFANFGEIEQSYRRSLELNPSLFSAADELATLLSEQRRYEDAESVLHKIRPRLTDASSALGRLAWIHRQQGKKQEAREQIANVVKNYPWYVSGWSLLTEWVIQDEAWEQARELLGKTPDELRTNPQFRRQRLVALGKAGLPVAELDTEWNQLLRDFPNETPLHLHRYDLLLAAKRLPDAHAVLNSFAPNEPNNQFYLARLVEVRAQEKKLDDAIGAMLKIFFADVESSHWPADYAWEAIKKAGFLEHAYHEARHSLESQRRPTPRAFFILGSYALQRAATQKVIPQPLSATFFPDRGVKELLKLLALADRCSWIDSTYRARALNLLNDVGHYRLVMKYWKKHHAELEATVETWSEVGRALASLRRNREVRQLASSWRKRRGVAMWMIANYVGCLSALRKDDLREIVSSSGDALRNLPHDHCARFLAHTKAEAHVLLGDKSGLLDTWNGYRSYFDCNVKPNEWFQDLRRPLLTDIPMLVRYLEQHQLGQYRRTVWGLRWRHISKALGRGKKRRGSLWWLWPLLWFAAVVLTLLFRN